jgi:hypothetical protein
MGNNDLRMIHDSINYDSINRPDAFERIIDGSSLAQRYVLSTSS